ncbi:MAG: aspartate kinase, partial [Maritimibacter sp.]|nr:aspartate kinase [Maritimibacter sp.]
KDLVRAYPSAEVTSRAISMASVVGRDLRGLSVLTRGLQAIAASGLEAIGASQGPRNVDVQFILEREALEPVIVALHRELVEAKRPALYRAA